jgi:Mn2+/Fe2+ NRAMP family transporter
MVWFGHYTLFEKITAVLVGLMFVTVVGLAVIAAPNVLRPGAHRPQGRDAVHAGARRRRRRHDHAGSLRLRLREKGWYTPKWMRVMRIDNTMAYVITGIFVVSMLIVGAEVVRAAGVSLSAGDEGLLASIIDQREGLQPAIDRRQ